MSAKTDGKTNKLDNRQLEKLETQVAELTEALKRERADSENIRRHHDAQVAALKQITKANVVRELLPIVDNLERSLAHIPKDIADSDYAKGVQSVIRQFAKTLGDIGVQRIKTIGEEFDPRIHEAVSADGEGSREVVSEELQSGYMLGDEVIRHAMVKVKLV